MVGQLWMSVGLSLVSCPPGCTDVCAGEAAKGVARSGFPRAADDQRPSAGGGLSCLSALRACSRALMRFLATVELCRKRWLSLPVSTMCQWCVSRSSRAVVIFASPNTLDHSAKSRLVVIITLVCS